MVKLKRVLRQLFTPHWAWKRAFPQATLDTIEAAIRTSERHHAGEIRFVIENSLPLRLAWGGTSGRVRALELFSVLRVWDTEANSGVLIYLLLADRDIEIVADRGIAARVARAEWEAIARSMESAFRQGDFARGALAGIAAVNALLALHCPPPAHNRNELDDRPLILGR